MFKKQVKIQNSHSVANKDKKKLKEALLNLKYEQKTVEAFLDDKQYENSELLMEKIQGSKAVIYSRQKVPLMFCPDSKTSFYYPTLYLLFQMPETVPLKVFLKLGVEQYIFNGADLMWPGIKAFSSEEFKANEIAIIFAKNKQSIGGSDLEYFPIAVGKILTNKIPENLKGKAIQVEHYLYDELWNYGPKKIPEEIQITKEEDSKQEGDPSLNQLQEEEKKEDSQINTNQQLPENTVSDTNSLPTKDQEEEKVNINEPLQSVEPQEEQQDPLKVPAEEMDPRIVEAFFRSLVESVKDSDLPMEPSDLLKDHLNMYSDINYKLDLRSSSFKRVIKIRYNRFQIGKLLEVMHKRGVIDYTEPKGINHKMITRINKSNEELKSYVPRFSLRKSKKASGLPGSQQEAGGNNDGSNYPKVEVQEVYQLSNKLNAVLANVKTMNQSQKYFSVKECRDLLTEYTKQNNLEEGAKKGSIKLDPILAQIVSLCDENQITKDKTKYFKGKVPSIIVRVHRVCNKKQTVLTGLELFQIDFDELLTFLSHKCSCSVTIQDLEQGTSGGKQPRQAVLLQGNHIDAIADEILPKRYKVPSKYIEKVNEISSKKGGKKK